MNGYVDALWVGPYGYRKAPEGTLLETGITVCSIPEGEAVASDNWQPVKHKRKHAPEPTPPGDVSADPDTGGDS